MTTLAFDDLSIAFGDRMALRGVTAEISTGGLVGLIGPNGAGKSTLIKAAARLIAPKSGRILLDGSDIDHIPRRDLARAVAYLPQGHALHWPLDAEQVVALGRLPHQGRFAAGTETDRAAVARAMAKTDVAAFAGRSVAALSGGERARIMLARALAVEAPVLLVDEPVASLDPYHQLQVMELLRDLAREGRLVIAVLHDLPLAARFCDRLLLLHQGRLIADGGVAEVLSRDRLTFAYSIEGLFGAKDGEHFVLAWRRLQDATRNSHV